MFLREPLSQTRKPAITETHSREILDQLFSSHFQCDEDIVHLMFHVV